MIETRTTSKFLTAVLLGASIALLADSRRRRTALGLGAKLLGGAARTVRAWAGRATSAVEAGRRAAAEKERELEGWIREGPPEYGA